MSVTCLKVKANKETLSVEILYSGIKEIIYSSVNKVLPSDFRLSISKEPSLIFYSEWWKDDWTFIGSLVYFDKRYLYIWNKKKDSKHILNVSSEPYVQCHMSPYKMFILFSVVGMY